MISKKDNVERFNSVWNTDNFLELQAFHIRCFFYSFPSSVKFRVCLSLENTLDEVCGSFSSGGWLRVCKEGLRGD